MARERIQKILAAAGVASRREAEKLIVAGRVAVDGETVTRLGSQADPATDRITLDGRPLAGPEPKLYLLLYKPRGYVSTLHDPEGRPTLLDLLPRLPARVFHVGRLDFNTEGLLLLTNDGSFAERVAHPRHGCEKGYVAKVSGVPSADALERLRRGVMLDGVRTAPARVDLVHSTRRDGNTWLALSLSEGRSREIRRMLEAVGHPVSKLKRVRIGSLEAGRMKPGEIRALEPREVKALSAGEASTSRTPPARGSVGARRGRGTSNDRRSRAKAAPADAAVSAAKAEPRRADRRTDKKADRGGRGGAVGGIAGGGARGAAKGAGRGKGARPRQRSRAKHR